MGGRELFRMRKYPERWVAIVDKKVVGVGKSISEAEKEAKIKVSRERDEENYIKILDTLGSVDAIVEDAIRKYLIDKCVERIEKSKRKIEDLEKKYDCNYAEFISKISNAEGLKAVEKTSLNWEGDMTEWEYWGNELKEWKARLEDILMKL